VSPCRRRTGYPRVEPFLSGFEALDAPLHELERDLANALAFLRQTRRLARTPVATSHAAAVGRKLNSLARHLKVKPVRRHRTVEPWRGGQDLGKQFRVLILAGIVVAVVARVGLAWAPQVEPSEALAAAPSTVTLASTWISGSVVRDSSRYRPVPQSPLVPDGTMLLGLGTVLIGLAAAVRRAGPPACRDGASR
jgi:hypothetical protein